MRGKGNGGEDGGCRGWVSWVGGRDAHFGSADLPLQAQQWSFFSGRPAATAEDTKVRGRCIHSVDTPLTVQGPAKTRYLLGISQVSSKLAAPTSLPGVVAGDTLDRHFTKHLAPDCAGRITSTSITTACRSSSFEPWRVLEDSKLAAAALGAKT